MPFSEWTAARYVVNLAMFWSYPPRDGKPLTMVVSWPINFVINVFTLPDAAVAPVARRGCPLVVAASCQALRLTAPTFFENFCTDAATLAAHRFAAAAASVPGATRTAAMPAAYFVPAVCIAETQLAAASDAETFTAMIVTFHVDG